MGTPHIHPPLFLKRPTYIHQNYNDDSTSMLSYTIPVSTSCSFFVPFFSECFSVIPQTYNAVKRLDPYMPLGFKEFPENPKPPNPQNHAEPCLCMASVINLALFTRLEEESPIFLVAQALRVADSPLSLGFRGLEFWGFRGFGYRILGV